MRKIYLLRNANPKALIKELQIRILALDARTDREALRAALAEFGDF